MDENLIQSHMRNLKISRAEAIQLIADDEAIDKGAKMFDLDPELEEGAKKARRAERKIQTAPVERKRKVNADKQMLIDVMADAVRETGVSYIGIYTDREFSFTYNGTKYKVVLSCPRT